MRFFSVEHCAVSCAGLICIANMLYLLISGLIFTMQLRQSMQQFTTASGEIGYLYNNYCSFLKKLQFKQSCFGKCIT
jgi:hypothetical protein